MMTLSRYICGMVVLVAAALTPSSCSDIAEQAMAYGETETVVLDPVADGQNAHVEAIEIQMGSDEDPERTGS